MGPHGPVLFLHEWPGMVPAMLNALHTCCIICCPNEFDSPNETPRLVDPPRFSIHGRIIHRTLFYKSRRWDLHFPSVWKPSRPSVYNPAGWNCIFLNLETSRPCFYKFRVRDLYCSLLWKPISPCFCKYHGQYLYFSSLGDPEVFFCFTGAARNLLISTRLTPTDSDSD